MRRGDQNWNRPAGASISTSNGWSRSNSDGSTIKFERDRASSELPPDARWRTTTSPEPKKTASALPSSLDE
jgi:hypothetical protein